jgi:hypothetical protein
MSQRIREVRMAHKAMADSRAMEEEAERMNPLDGRGATPSMGLSQFRGGAKKATAKSLGKRIAKMEAASPSMAQTEEDAMAVMPSGEYDGAGMMGCGKSEAMAQGSQLGQHLHRLHGGAYVKEFMSGMGMCGSGQSGAYEGEGKLTITHGGASHMEGGFLGALASMAIPLIGSLFGKGEMKKSAHTALMKHFNKKPRSKKPELQGGFWGSLLSAAVPLIGSLFGKGAMTKKAHDDLVAMVKKHEGKGMSGAGRMVGAGRAVGAGKMEMESESECEMESPKAPKKRRVVGAGDGRRKRAEIVRRVMKEKGMKMIEASKYVKEHGLY